MSQSHVRKAKVSPPASLDYSGIFVSILCLVHCLGTPLLLFLVPSLIGVEAGHSVLHGLLLVFIIPLAIFSFWRCYNLHRSVAPSILGSVGVSLLISALVFADFFLLESVERPFTIAGSAFLVAGHFLNLKKCRCIQHEKCSHD